MNPTVNPALSDLRDIHLPPPISWWPPAPGWWLLAALLLITMLGVIIWHRLRRRNRWRRSALAELTRLRQQHASQASSAQAVVGALSVLLRRVAISRFPREEVAALTGDAWLAFLDRSLGDGTLFQSDSGRLLSLGPYQPDAAMQTDSLPVLFSLCERWIKKLPARSKQ